MERTCRCGKAECPKCEAWWNARARAFDPSTIGRGALKLNYDEVVVFRECQHCGYEIPDPFDDIGQIPVTCSTCAAGTREQRVVPGPDLPAICDCARYFLAHGGLGWSLSQCDAHKCFPPTVNKVTATARHQGKLF